MLRFPFFFTRNILRAIDFRIIASSHGRTRTPKDTLSSATVSVKGLNLTSACWQDQLLSKHLVAPCNRIQWKFSCVPPNYYAKKISCTLVLIQLFMEFPLRKPARRYSLDLVGTQWQPQISLWYIIIPTTHDEINVQMLYIDVTIRLNQQFSFCFSIFSPHSLWMVPKFLPVTTILPFCRKVNKKL